MAEILQQIPPSQYPIKIFSAGDEIKQLLRAQRPIVNRRAIDYHSAALRHVKDRIWQKEGHNTPAIQADSLYASVVAIPSNFESSPVNGVTTKYIKMMHNKLKSPIFCAQWDPDGRRLVTGAASGEFTLWNAINFSFEALLQAHDAPIRSMRWSHGHEWLISSDDRGLVKYWQSNMNNVHTFQAHSDPVRCLSLSPNDTKMVTGSDDGTVRIWDFLTCHEEFILRGHGADVKCIDWHPSKALVVSGSKDNQQPVKLWDPKAGQGISTLHLHKGAVQDVKWNANGNWLLTASRDHLIKVLDIRAMKEMYVLRGHRRDVNTVAWHPVHECLFASGGSDGGIYFWIVGNTRDVGCMESAHDGFIWNLAWHPLGHVLCSASNDHTCKLWVRNKPGDEMIDKYNTSSHHGAGEISDIEIAGANLPGVGYAKQQQNASITLPPPKMRQQSEKIIPTTDSKDYGVRVENSGISVPVLGKDLVLTEKDLVNIANSISSTNRDISQNVAQELKPPPDAQPPPSNNPPFEPRRNFNHDVPWETNYPPRPMPPPHSEWNQPPPMGPPREDFNRPPPKEWEGLPPQEEFRRFHGRPNEWIHPSRRPEGAWGFDHQRDRRPPPEFRRDMFRGDREPGMRDFPPDQPMDDRRMQEGFHRFDEHNRPIGGPPLRDPFRWERGKEPAWRGRDQFDAARGPNGPDGQRPPFPDQQQQQQQQQRNLDNESNLRQQISHEGQPDAAGPPKNQDTLQDVNRSQPNLKEAPFQVDHQASVQPFDPAKGPGPLPGHPGPPADSSRVMRSQENQVPPNQLRGIDSPLQGGPPPNFHQHFDAGRNLEGNMPPPMSNQQPFGHARDPRMQEAPVNQHPFLDHHKQIPPNFPDGPPPPNQFNRGDAPPQQGIPPGRPPEGPPLHQHHPLRGARGQEPAWLQDPNKPPLQRIGSGINDGTFPPNQQQQFDPGNLFPPTDGSMPPFDPNRNVPPFPNAIPPFINQEQHGMGNQLPRSETGPKLHPPEIMDGPKRPEQFVQKGPKQKDSTVPPWRDPKAAEQIIGNTFNEQAANQQQFFRSLLQTPMQDGGNPMEEPAPDQFPPGHNPLNEPGLFDKGPPPFSQGPLFNDRAPGQNMDPRMRNARKEMGFDPRMDGPRIDQNFNPRMEAQQQPQHQQMPPPGEIGGMGHPDPGRRHDFRMDGRPPMGQKFDPRMRPPGKEDPMHPPQEFLGGRDRDLAQDPPWHNSGIEQRLGPPREFSDENFNDPKRRTLLPPPIMVHKDEESGSFHNNPGRQDEFSGDNRRREQQRFDDYRGDKSWSNRSEYDRGRREPQREPRRSPTRRNSNDRPPAKRQRREKDMSKPSSRHSEGRGDGREKDRNSDKDRKPERNRDKTKSSEKPSSAVSNDKAKLSKS